MLQQQPLTLRVLGRLVQGFGFLHAAFDSHHELLVCTGPQKPRHQPDSGGDRQLARALEQGGKMGAWGGGYSLQEHVPVQRLGSLQKAIPAAALPQKAPAPWLPQVEPHKAQRRGQQEEEAAQRVLWGHHGAGSPGRIGSEEAQHWGWRDCC